MTLLASVRRHSLRVQQRLHRWSICVSEGGRLLSEGPHGPGVGPPRSRSCCSEEPPDPSPSASGPFTVALLGEAGVGKTALASIFAGAPDSLESDLEPTAGTGQGAYSHS